MSLDNEETDKKDILEDKLIPKDTEKLIEEAELVLKKKQAHIKDEILKIGSLIKKKYLLIESENKTKQSFSNIKESAHQLNLTAREQALQIENLIRSQETEIKKLKEEKILLDRNNIHFDIIENQKLLIENYKDNNDQHQLNLDELNIELNKINNENKKLLINNNELKDALGRYIKHNKNLQININELKKIQLESVNDKSLIKEMLTQIKFYQEDNSRLSNELVNLKDKYEVIKNNFNETQREKNNIFKQIKELNNSLTKTNIVGTPYVKEKVKEVNINSEVLNEITENNLENEKKSFKEDNNLDKEIEDIFS